MVKEEKKEVLLGIIATHQNICLGKHTVAQVHPSLFRKHKKKIGLDEL
jgi:hypothetical protein